MIAYGTPSAFANGEISFCQLLIPSRGGVSNMGIKMCRLAKGQGG